MSLSQQIVIGAAHYGHAEVRAKIGGNVSRSIRTFAVEIHILVIDDQHTGRSHREIALCHRMRTPVQLFGLPAFQPEAKLIGENRSRNDHNRDQRKTARHGIRF